MARTLNRLTVRQVQSTTEAGRYADGSGLYLKVRPGGSRQWVFLFANMVDGKRVQTEIGLGSAADPAEGLCDGCLHGGVLSLNSESNIAGEIV